MKYELIQSPVAFSENPHGYWLGEKRLLGITGLIHEILGLGVYPDASEFVKKTAIPRAGEYGSSIHKAIEIYDQIGIRQTVYPNSYGSEPWDVSRELENYINNRQGFAPVANEYTVSDNAKWASNIDNVWERVEDNTIFLVDTKSNNLDYYPGGEDALKEYLSWQLSIYAVLFERQNPGLKVGGLACNWLRKEESQFWEIPRKSDAEVDLLLLASYEFDENGEAHYTHPNAELLSSHIVLKENDVAIVPEDVVRLIYAVAKEAEEAKAKLEELKAQLRKAMDAHEVKSWDAKVFKATIAKDSTTTSFNLEKFKKDMPDLASKYMEQKTKKGGFTIKLKDND